MLQEPINTDKLQILLDDPLYKETMGRFMDDPLFDVVINEAEKAQTDIPMYSLSEVYPDFKKVFRPIKTTKQEINIASLAGTVEQQHEHYRHGFKATGDELLAVEQLSRDIISGSYDSQTQPIRVHAIPSQNKFQGFVADGARIVAAHILAGRQTLWAEVTFYKQVGE